MGPARLLPGPADQPSHLPPKLNVLSSVDKRVDDAIEKRHVDGEVVERGVEGQGHTQVAHEEKELIRTEADREGQTDYGEGL